MDCCAGEDKRKGHCHSAKGVEQERGRKEYIRAYIAQTGRMGKEKAGSLKPKKCRSNCRKRGRGG